MNENVHTEGLVVEKGTEKDVRAALVAAAIYGALLLAYWSLKRLLTGEGAPA